MAMEALMMGSSSCIPGNDLRTAGPLLHRFKAVEKKKEEKAKEKEKEKEKKTMIKSSSDSNRKLKDSDAAASGIASNPSWASLIRLSTKLGDPEGALRLFFRIQSQGILLPDSHVFVAALQACSSSPPDGCDCGSSRSNGSACSDRHSCSRNSCSSGNVSKGRNCRASFSRGATCAPQSGRLIEFLLVAGGLSSHLILGNSLIHMYARLGLFDDANHVFHRIEGCRRNVVTWSSMMSGLATYGHSDQAFRLFQDMQCEGNVALDSVNKVPFLCVLKSCPSLHIGKVIHTYVVALGVGSDVVVQNALIEMYAKCGSLSLCTSVFERSLTVDVVTFGSMIGGFIKHNRFVEAFILFERMLGSSIQPNEVIFVYMLKACLMRGSLDDGKLVHSLVIEDDISFYGTIANTLIDIYGKLGNLDDAFRVFDRSPKRDVVTWSALISACCIHDRGKEALQLFHTMQETSHIDPDEIIFTCTLKACSNISALRKGQVIHIHLIELGNGFEHSASNTLIDLYIKCGCLYDACRVFDGSSKQSVATWNTILLGCCECAQFHLAKEYFVEMQQKGIKPNTMTFSCLLLTCSHMGRVCDGLSFYKLMYEDHGIAPDLGHFVSLVHLLGHTGHLEEAECLLATMPSGPGVVGWRSLLCQCGTHGNVKLGQQCFESVSLGDGREAAGYVLMATMHPQLDTRVEVEDMRKYVNAWKKPAQAFIEIDGEVHGFNVGEECHPQIRCVHEKLKQMWVKMVDEGYVQR